MLRTMQKCLAPRLYETQRCLPSLIGLKLIKDRCLAMRGCDAAKSPLCLGCTRHFERPMLLRTELQQRNEMPKSVAPTTDWLGMGTLRCPFSVETYGRLGKPAVVFLSMLCAKAVACGDVSKSGFVAAAPRELSVGLYKGDYLMHRVSLGVLAGVSGRGFRPGADRPVEVVCD
jgi:hypothetical protein